MKILGVIPARFKSSRFPGKPLIPILGIPMIIRVAHIVAEALGKENVVIATEDTSIKLLVESYDFRVVMTSDNCMTGTDRVWEVAKKNDADIYINIQGDEPLLDPKDIIKILNQKINYPNHVINGMINLSDEEDVNNINIPKVLVNSDNLLIYMSRLAIPGIKDSLTGVPSYMKQVCIYAFSYDELKKFGELKKKSEFEKFEDIEILRFLDLGVPIKMVQTSFNSLAVDVPEDVINVENALRKDL